MPKGIVLAALALIICVRQDHWPVVFH